MTAPPTHPPTPRPRERSLFLTVDTLRVPARARAEFETWGCALRRIVGSLLRGRPSPLTAPGAPRQALAALADDLRYLAAFAAEVSARQTDEDALAPRLEHARRRLLDLSFDLDPGLEAPAGSGPATLEKEVVDVGL